MLTDISAAVMKKLVIENLFLASLSAKVNQVESAFTHTVEALARATEANDEDTDNHNGVGMYCAIIAKHLGMPDSFISLIRLQALMHDVGKIHIHPDILRKPDKLTSDEFAVMKQHTLYGSKILGNHKRLTLAKEIALSHHERWDGSGYPQGLKGKDIPISARITNIADQYDALRNQRCYKPAFDHMTTYKILTEGDGRTIPNHFDPQILKAFREAASKFEAVSERLKGSKIVNN